VEDYNVEESYVPALNTKKIFQQKTISDLGNIQDLFRAAIKDQGSTVWIPQDKLGVSDDEIRWSKRLSRDLNVSNRGAIVDENRRVICDQGPP
jgi:Extracellular tail, of 10TM putative phosphate transporter